jgi:exopolyphosphatase
MPNQYTYTPVASNETPSQHPSTPIKHKRQASTSRSICKPRISWACPSFGLILLLPLSLFVLSISTYLAPGAEHMRPCLPFSLTRLSQAAHQRLSCEGIAISASGSGSGYKAYSNTTKTSSSADTMDNIDPTANGGVKEGRLAGFLQSQKELFLQDLRDGKGKGWTVATGNEAGGGWMTEVSK